MFVIPRKQLSALKLISKKESKLFLWLQIIGTGVLLFAWLIQNNTINNTNKKIQQLNEMSNSIQRIVADLRDNINKTRLFYSTGDTLSFRNTAYTKNEDLIQLLLLYDTYQALYKESNSVSEKEIRDYSNSIDRINAAIDYKSLEDLFTEKADKYQMEINILFSNVPIKLGKEKTTFEDYSKYFVCAYALGSILILISLFKGFS